MTAVRRVIRPAVYGLSLGVLLVSCAELERPALPVTGPNLAQTTGSTLIECPTDVTRSATGTIDLLGGTLSVNGTSIAIPAGAVLLPTEFTLTVPASNYMEIDITANGAEHFQFEDFVTVTISYERCSRSNIDKSELTAWYYDSATQTLIEDMHGTDSKTARTVTFDTDHLSEYAIAD